MSIAERLDDADLLWRADRHEGALLVVLCAVSATARRGAPAGTGDRDAFVQFLKSTHGWTIGVEHHGRTVDLDLLFYKWLRCELVHAGGLPPDIRFDDQFAAPGNCAVRAGGAPSYTVLLGYGWYQFFVTAVRTAPVNTDQFATADVVQPLPR